MMSSPVLAQPSAETKPQAAIESTALHDHFDPGHLTQESLDDYLKSAAAGTFDPRFAVFAGRPDWSQGKDPFPLGLCEFLAYKSVLAYEKKKDIEDYLVRSGWQPIADYHYVFFENGKRGDTQGFGFVNGDSAYIIMRGSDSITDWVANFDLRVTTDPRLSQEELNRIGGAFPERHFGFADAWSCVADIVIAWVNSLPPNVTHLCFSGHSQGGALAILAAYDFARKKIRNVGAVVTFAAPKVGNAEFKADYEKPELGLKQCTLRCQSTEDAVTWLTTHPHFVAPGQSWDIKHRPMIAGMERFWAGVLFIAGWESGKALTSSPSAPPAKPAAEAVKDAPKDAAKPVGTSAETSNKETQQKPSGNSPISGTQAFVIVLGAIALIVVFFVSRHAIIRYRAHGASKRYALYFTTLSYRKIREIRFTDKSNPSEAEMKRASGDLDLHLRRVRGADTEISSFKVLANRPIRILDPATYQRFVKETRPEGPNGEPAGGYALYIY